MTGDLDGDGDLDVVSGEHYGALAFFRNTVTRIAPAFQRLTGAANPLAGQDLGKASMPALADLDGDGEFSYFENTGTATGPAFVSRTGSANPLDGRDVGLDSSPTFVDLDADGDADVVSGEQNGTLVPYYLPEPLRRLGLACGAVLLAGLAIVRPRADKGSGWSS